MSAAVEELREKDPEKTRISVLLRRETSDVALAQALEQNPFVTDIFLGLERVQQTEWDSLLRVIATRANLGKVIVEDAGFVGRRSALSPGLVRSILRAIQQNSSIRSVYLEWLNLPTDISMFLDNASSITSFGLRCCVMDPAELQLGARSLAVALQRNTNIETLRLSGLEDVYTVPTLEGLRSNASLKTFIFSPTNFSDATSRAIQHLLESTTSIQRFELQHEDFRGERFFRPIAQGITSSECVSELVFDWCRFSDQNSFAQLRSILQNKRNLTSLCLRDCYFGGGQVHGDIISILLRPDSLLRCFEFQSLHSLEGVFAGIQFKNLLQAIQKSKLLERFSIGPISTPHQFQTLTESIPSMKLKELEVEFYHDEEEEELEFVPETMRRELLHAVKNNFSLRSVKARIIDFWRETSDLFDSVEEKQRLTFYANRNGLLDQWGSNIDLVERKVWPDALNLTEKAGPTALFRGLRSVLESDYGSLSAGRKRKRPQYYTPT